MVVIKSSSFNIHCVGADVEAREKLLHKVLKSVHGGRVTQLVETVVVWLVPSPSAKPQEQKEEGKLVKFAGLLFLTDVLHWLFSFCKQLMHQ